ncbi:formate dehydrogenase accessory sulfurtransferase FdhD [Paenibacillus aurantius]|uniref:Sulfur carrier protein FdhD n=1 Tax=Paenibacillus aurantius TaxID=2918900 RepID=A0AA96LB31_9BACL|nr:formate dehydrogenase accessory sulfurtransferase FdhD [Paenibacillus aurantius]WJH35273.1 formate dehydrogenase accessory sulfurtransferase FdhD [Paenibacillus sp. CC-CFT747]WNQ10554.1 formate dehydrogenase accessory sulfurtransferase FdhD [Paenibacillus aurantius]
MERRVTVRRPILRYDGEALGMAEDEIASEYALTVWVNDEEFATMVCTPEHLEELTVGFLASEGIIRKASDLSDLTIDESRGMAYATVPSAPAFTRDLTHKRYLTSCCGKSRSFTFYNDARTARKVTGSVTLTVGQAFALQSALQEGSSEFRATGGFHNAALCRPEGILLTRADIGRHNALDKLYGRCLLDGTDPSSLVIAFSGRMSSEVLLKAAKLGSPVLLSKSAPTGLALDLAEELGITAVGFIRGRTLNVYSHPERIRV